MNRDNNPEIYNIFGIEFDSKERLDNTILDIHNKLKNRNFGVDYSECRGHILDKESDLIEYFFHVEFRAGGIIDIESYDATEIGAMGNTLLDVVKIIDLNTSTKINSQHIADKLITVLVQWRIDYLKRTLKDTDTINYFIYDDNEY